MPQLWARLGDHQGAETYGTGDDAESVATLHRALDLGVTFLDTAADYGLGANERLVGRAIRTRRDGVVVATKFGVERDGARLGVNGRPEYVRKACDESLQRLGVEHIDLYYQHRVDPCTPIEATWGAMAELVEGSPLPRHLRGGSGDHPQGPRGQSHNCPADRVFPVEPGRGGRGVADDAGARHRVRPVQPARSRFLTGRISSPDDFAEDDFRRASPRFRGENFRKNLELVDRVRELASQKGVTLGQLALAWLLHQGDDIVPIPGTRRRERLEENVAAAYVELTIEDLGQIEDVSPKGAAAAERYDEAGM